MGVDYGEKNVGVALSEGTLAQALTQFPAREALVRLHFLCHQHGVRLIVLGLPEGRLHQKVIEFAKELVEKLNIQVKLWDETLSSYQATEALKLKQRKKAKQQVHQTAAAHILQSYLDAKHD